MDCCPLCEPGLGPVIHEGRYWKVVVNHNQNLLGKWFLSLKRHSETVTTLGSEEWHELHVLLTRTTEILRRAFKPDHFNYVFLQNQDRHVHLHVIPRYASPREFVGLSFRDTGWPGHYDTQQAAWTLTDNQYQELKATLGSLNEQRCRDDSGAAAQA